MGTKDPDVVCMPPRPGVALTVGEMRDLKWRIAGTCTRCRTRLWIDLAQLAVLVGDGALMWGRTGRCRLWTWGDQDRCPGTVLFDAQSIRGGSWVRLALTPEVEQLWWRRRNPGLDRDQVMFEAAMRRKG